VNVAVVHRNLVRMFPKTSSMKFSVKSTPIEMHKLTSESFCR